MSAGARTPSHEPRLARVAALVADPARSRMLAHLMSGAWASAGELAAAASVTAATASGHLARLRDGGLVVCEARGRHRYHRLAGPEVAQALEALALVAERDPRDRVWGSPARQRLRHARCCYGHLAGTLGVRLFDTLLSRGHLRDGADGLALTEAGRGWLQQTVGLAPPEPQRQRRYAYRCLDWSERRDHLAGQLADALLQHFLQQDWLRRAEGRVLQLGVAGQHRLLPLLLPAPAGP